METVRLDFLQKRPRLEKSQDYELLRAEGLEHIERLAHALWTDYNVHDPGVTLLELLCYAITDLGYRTGYRMRDILTETVGGLPVNRNNFHTARQIFTSNPVSFDDLRKVLIDVEGVRNAWIEPHCSVRYRLDRKTGRLIDALDEPRDAGSLSPLGGLYDLFIEYEDRVQRDSILYHAGILEKGDGDGAFVEPLGRGIRFDVAQELTLEAVSVYPETAGSLKVRLLDKNGVAVAPPFETNLERAGEKNRIPLGVRLMPGKGYRLETSGDSPHLYRTAEPRFPYFIEDVISLVSGSKGDQDQKPYLFFYDWEVSAAVARAAAPGPGSESRTSRPQTTPIRARSTLVTRQEVRSSVVDRLHRHRNLCEDFVNVCDLSTEEIGLCADVEAAPDADLEELQAEIFFRLARHVSPPVRFYTLGELLERGKTADEIFEGPALDHGFIDDDEFRSIQRRCEIRTSDVVRIVMEIPGVRAIKSISLLSFLDGKLRTHEEWVLELATDRFRAPEFSPQRSKIIFYRNELPYYANRMEVEARVKEKKASELQTKLKRHDHDLPVPLGEDKHLADYYPLQNELPLNYLVGRNRVPASETPLRKAQSRQLKAYLMFFEQLLANYLEQLSRVPSLFSWEETNGGTYFTQPVTGIADVAEIYDETRIAETYGTLAEALDAIAEDRQTAEERRGRFLDHLIARFCESFTDYSLLLFSLVGESAREKLNRDKGTFLKEYPDLSANRGRAHDYRFPEDPDNLSGYQRRVYRLLGIEDLTRRRLAGHRLEIFFDEEAGGWRFVLKKGEEDGPPEADGLFESRVCESRDHVEALLDFAIEIGGERENYVDFVLVLRCPGVPDEVVGSTTSDSNEELGEVIRYFKEVHRAEGFHVVEQVLLRKRTLGDRYLAVQLGGDCDCVEVRDPYSFRMVVVLPSWPERFRDLRFRRLVEDSLRREAPAHVYPRICWINHAQMKRFETVYESWSSALADLAAKPPGCRAESGAAREALRSGELPLPPATAGDEEYRRSLEELISTLQSLVTVYPLARLHDCRETRGDTPQITLNNTSLGTF
jgi:hypothetical protein